MLVTLCGPSCAGKSTLEAMLKKRGFVNVVSCTTRAMREGEEHGKSYYFMTREEFADLDAKGGLVESNRFGENYYGVSVSELERLIASGSPVVVVCEPVGQKNLARYCRERGWPIFGVFVDGSADVIGERFLRRFKEEVFCADDSEIEKKIAAYKVRFNEMMTTERDWCKEAWLHDFYDMRLKHFDETNDKQTVEFLVGIAAERKVA